MMKRERCNLEDDKILRKRKGAKEWEKECEERVCVCEEREVIYR